jgi:hypothetical protein
MRALRGGCGCCYFCVDSFAGRAATACYELCLKALQSLDCFFFSPLRKIALRITLRTAGAEDRAPLGSDLSAGSGAKTKLRFSEELDLSSEFDFLGLASTR